jgi:hypothetical protein
MVNVLLILALAVAMLAALFVIPSLMTRRAVSKVIKTFCQSDALDAEHARTPDELGLVPPAFFERMTRPRDYRPHALRFLKEANLVHATTDGKLYLSRRECGQEMSCSRLLAHQVRTALKRYTRT